jgi:cytochrome c oxidase cbb3-type subunit 3
MSENKNDQSQKNKNDIDVLVEGHDYDGVQEFNNPAPFWWQLFFYISIVWAIGYMVYYLGMNGPTLTQELNQSLDKIKAAQPAVPQGGGVSEEVLALAVTDPAQHAVGARVYVEKCLACHLADGGGSIGPNLVDNHWIHGRGTLMAIYEVVKTGVADKGMPGWGPLITEAELVAVSGYVKSLKGQPVAVAKAPQGELVED